MHADMCGGLHRSVLTMVIALVLAFAGSSEVKAGKVVVIDSGSNLAGITGFDYVRGDDIPNDETDGHGTTISRIINTYKPVSDIIAFKVVPGSFEFNPTLSEAAYLDALEVGDARVIDLSNRNPISLDVLLRAVGRGKLIVLNAGNRAGPAPDGLAQFAPFMDGNAIIVGAVDVNNNIASYSNRAGGPETADLFVVAPGFTQFSSNQGTSFAKPHVSALAALLFWTFPHLSPQEVSRVIRETAIDLGPAGVDSIYGWGLISFERALGPEGEMIIAGSGGGNGGGSGGAGAIALVAVIGAGVAALSGGNKEPLETTLVMDKYRRTFMVDLNEVMEVRPSRGSMSAILRSLNTLEKTHVERNSADSFSVLRVTKRSLENSVAYNPTSWLNDDPGFIPEPSLSYYQNALDGSGYGFHVNQGMTHEFGALGLASSPEDPVSFLSNGVFSSPFLGYTTDGFASHMTHSFTENSSFRFGVSHMDESTRFGLRSDSAVFEVVHQRDRCGVSAYAGQLLEYGSLFGGSSGGAFSVDDTLTYSFGVSGSYELTEEVRLIGNYSHGYSKVDDMNGALLQDFSTLESDSWAMGLLFDNLFRGRDRLGFALSQPIKVTNGSATLSVPYSISADNVISSTSERTDLGAGGRELALESFYRTWLGKSTRFTTYLMHQINPLHNTSAPDETTIMGILEYQF